MLYSNWVAVIELADNSHYDARQRKSVEQFSSCSVYGATALKHQNQLKQELNSVLQLSHNIAWQP